MVRLSRGETSSPKSPATRKGLAAKFVQNARDVAAWSTKRLVNSEALRAFTDTWSNQIFRLLNTLLPMVVAFSRRYRITVEKLRRDPERLRKHSDCSHLVGGTRARVIPKQENYDTRPEQ